MIVVTTQSVSALWERFEGVAENQRRDVSVDAIMKLRIQCHVLDGSIKRWVAEAHPQGATWVDIGCAPGIAHQVASRQFGSSARTVECLPSGAEPWSVPVGPTQNEEADVPHI